MSSLMAKSLLKAHTTFVQARSLHPPTVFNAQVVHLAQPTMLQVNCANPVHKAHTVPVLLV